MMGLLVIHSQNFAGRNVLVRGLSLSSHFQDRKSGPKNELKVT